MSLTLDAITLPSDLLWNDEYAYTPVKQTISTAVDGSLIVEAAAALAGRPITLAGADDSAWCSRSTLEALRLKQAQPGLVMTLTVFSTPHSVLFVQPGITAKPIVDFSNPESGDWYAVTLKFMEV